MRVLRKGGQFTDGRIDQHFSQTLSYLACGVLVFAVLAFFGLKFIGLLAGILIVAGGAASFRQWGNWSLGKRGELAVTDTLKSLPDDYVVLNDLVLPDNGGNIDHLLIGPNGIFAIETKNYSGYVKCEEEQWYVNGHRIRSLSKQAKRNSMAVRRSIGGLYGDLKGTIPYVVPLLTFVNPQAKLKLFKPTVPVLRLAEVVEFVLDYQTKRPISPDEKRAIVHQIQSLQPIANHPSPIPAAAKDRAYRLT